MFPWEPLDISFLGEAIRPGMVPWAAEPPKSPVYSVPLSASPSPTHWLLLIEVVKEMVCELEIHF